MPMQWADVLQAEVMEKLMPLTANAVDKLADTVEPIHRVTWYGPTRRTPLLRKVSAASTWLADDAPPEPMMRPVRGWETCSGVSPAWAIASLSDR